MNQNLATLIIAGYTSIIKRVEQMEDVGEIKALIESSHAQYGICHYEWCNFKTSILLWSHWLDEKLIGVSEDGYLAEPPLFCSDKPDILAALQLRVDILKTFKEE